MPARTVVDQLREEYFRLLPQIRRVAGQLEAEIKFHVRTISHDLQEHEQLVVVSRVKECESAIESLRLKQEFGTFDEDRPDLYTLASLSDLAGVRILAFPSSRLGEIDLSLRMQFKDWERNGISEDAGGGYSYFGYCASSRQVQAEYQIVSLLIGRYWDVEHAALYKYRGGARLDEVQEKHRAVVTALKAFEAAYQRALAQPHDAPE
jgi:ppGpp synthetase/RelA/SpoT-type nucleotidyltranferase